MRGVVDEMAILINEKTRVAVQGVTGKQGLFHAQTMRDYGTKIVAGVTPGKGGSEIDGFKVYDSLSELEGQVDASIIFVPATFSRDAALEAIEAGLDPVVVVTEHVPVRDSMEFVNLAREKSIHVVGPNTPGLISPGKCKMGIMPNHIFREGGVGVVSRSGTLTYEIVDNLSKAGLGQSTAVGLGGDPIVGLGFTDVLELFEQDSETEAVVLIGEIGGNAEEQAAEYVRENMSKPVVAYIAGRTAPEGKRMGHAGAVVTGKAGTYKSKVEAFKKNKISVAELPRDVVGLLKEQI